MYNDVPRGTVWHQIQYHRYLIKYIIRYAMLRTYDPLCYLIGCFPSNVTRRETLRIAQFDVSSGLQWSPGFAVDSNGVLLDESGPASGRRVQTASFAEKLAALTATPGHRMTQMCNCGLSITVHFKASPKRYRESGVELRRWSLVICNQVKQGRGKATVSSARRLSDIWCIPRVLCIDCWWIIQLDRERQGKLGGLYIH